VTAYALAYAACCCWPAGSGRAGIRKTFLLGLIAFGLTSAGAAVATNPGELVIFRALQGASAAFVSPAALALLDTSSVTASGAREPSVGGPPPARPAA